MVIPPDVWLLCFAMRLHAINPAISNADAVSTARHFYPQAGDMDPEETTVEVALKIGTAADPRAGVAHR
jgi:hypothetical protein